MSLFSVTTFVLFHFALQPETALSGEAGGAALLWVTLLFAAVLGINRLFVADAEQGGFDGFLLSPAAAQRAALVQGADAARLPTGAGAGGRAGFRPAAARAAAVAGAAEPVARCSHWGTSGSS